MLVALLNTKPTPLGKRILDCFAKGVDRNGDTTVFVDGKNDLPAVRKADVAVQVCYPNIRHDGSPLPVFRLEANAEAEKAGIRVLTIDTGFLQPNAVRYRRAAGKPLPGHDVLTHYSVGYDGLKATADYCVPKPAPPDRALKLNVDLRPWRRTGSHVLVLGQRRFGLSTQHVDMWEWYARVLREVRRLSSRPVLFRPHPRVGDRTSWSVSEKAVVDEIFCKSKNASVSRNTTLDTDLKGAWVTVAVTTNAAVHSVVSGIPVVTSDQSCMAYPVSSHKILSVNNPSTPDRVNWLREVAYCQWSCAEMASGEVWSHMRGRARRV